MSAGPCSGAFDDHQLRFAERATRVSSHCVQRLCAIPRCFSISTFSSIPLSCTNRLTTRGLLGSFRNRPHSSSPGRGRWRWQSVAGDLSTVPEVRRGPTSKSALRGTDHSSGHVFFPHYSGEDELQFRREAERRSGTARYGSVGHARPYVHDVHHVPEEVPLSDTFSV